jgi:hypothetical protein
MVTLFNPRSIQNFEKVRVLVGRRELAEKVRRLRPEEQLQHKVRTTEHRSSVVGATGILGMGSVGVGPVAGSGPIPILTVTSTEGARRVGTTPSRSSHSLTTRTSQRSSRLRRVVGALLWPHSGSPSLTTRKRLTMSGRGNSSRARNIGPSRSAKYDKFFFHIFTWLVGIIIWRRTLFHTLHLHRLRMMKLEYRILERRERRTLKRLTKRKML